MHPFFQDYLGRLTTLHQGVLEAIQGLPSEALDWTPIDNLTDEMNTINVLVTHLTETEHYWIGDVAPGESSERIRESKSRSMG